MVATAYVLAQVLLTFHPTTDGPLRFGVPLPAKQLSRGLRLETRSGARLQWRRLQMGQDANTGQTWVELCLTGANGTSRILAGGKPAAERDDGPVVRRSLQRKRTDACTVWTERWLWHTGERDELTRRIFHARHLQGDGEAGEVFDAGEGLTTWSPGFLARCLGAGVPPRHWRRAGVLPGNGRLAPDVRKRLQQLAPALQQAPGLRGRGDYSRSGGVMTNLEFDTTLGFAKLGLALGDPDLLRRAWCSAVHLVDLDLDADTGLAHEHGLDHRSNAPDPGHTWLQGLLLAGCLFADRQLIQNARRIAVGIATHPVSRQGRRDRLRDQGWPLLELESWLRFEDHLEVRRAADAIAQGLKARWDPDRKVVRFGEGKRRRGVYQATLWLEGGVLLPALRKHLTRTGDPQVRRIVGSLSRRLQHLTRSGKPGIPTHCWLADGEVIRDARTQQQAAGFMVLEGLAPDVLRRILKRRLVKAALADTPATSHKDLPTAFSIVARCEWIYR